MGLIVSPSNSYAEVLTLVPENGTLFGNAVIVDVTSSDEVILESMGP